MTIEPGASGIAIIGMACRFPGAETPTEFWENLRSGTESITFFSDEELIGAGVDPALVRNQNYIKASPILKNVDMFDAAFFGTRRRKLPSWIHSTGCSSRHAGKRSRMLATAPTPTRMLS